MRIIASITLMLCLLLSACKHKDVVYKEVESSKNLFTMQVPDYMAASNMLPGKATLQYSNDSVKLYLLAFDTTREGLNETTLEAFYDSTVSRPSVLEGATMDPRKFSMVSGDSAYITALHGSLQGVLWVYKMEIIATPTRFFYIQACTREDKEKELNEVIDKMLQSFHDVNHVKV